MYSNFCKIENENLRKQIKEIKEHEIEKETKYQLKIEELKNKIQESNLAEIKGRKPEPDKKDNENSMKTDNNIKQAKIH